MLEAKMVLVEVVVSKTSALLLELQESKYHDRGLEGDPAGQHTLAGAPEAIYMYIYIYIYICNIQNRQLCHWPKPFQASSEPQAAGPVQPPGWSQQTDLSMRSVFAHPGSMLRAVFCSNSACVLLLRLWDAY